MCIHPKHSERVGLRDGRVCGMGGGGGGISLSDKRFTDEKNGSAIAQDSFTLVKGCKRM